MAEQSEIQRVYCMLGPDCPFCKELTKYRRLRAHGLCTRGCGRKGEQVKHVAVSVDDRRRSEASSAASIRTARRSKGERLSTEELLCC